MSRLGDMLYVLRASRLRRLGRGVFVGVERLASAAVPRDYDLQVDGQLQPYFEKVFRLYKLEIPRTIICMFKGRKSCLQELGLPIALSLGIPEARDILLELIRLSLKPRFSLSEGCWARCRRVWGWQTSRFDRQDLLCFSSEPEPRAGLE